MTKLYNNTDLLRKYTSCTWGLRIACVKCSILFSRFPIFLCLKHFTKEIISSSLNKSTNQWLLNSTNWETMLNAPKLKLVTRLWWISWRKSFENPEQSKELCTRSILRSYVHKISFRTESKLLYNFLIKYFSESPIVRKIGMSFLSFAAKWHCK